MKLWLLERLDEVGYDENEGFVIRAEDEQAARQIAFKARGDELSETWTDQARSSCTELVAEVNAPGIILRSFNAG